MTSAVFEVDKVSRHIFGPSPVPEQIFDGPMNRMNLARLSSLQYRRVTAKAKKGALNLFSISPLIRRGDQDSGFINGSNMWLLHRTTPLSSALLRRSLFSEPLTPRQNSPPRKMNSRNDSSSQAPVSPATPSGNSVISCDSVSAGVKDGNAHRRNRNCQILKVGTIPILSYDSSGNFKLISFAITSAPADKKQCSSLSADIHFDEMKSYLDLVSKQNMEDTSVSSNSKSISETELKRWSPMPDWKSQMREFSLPTEFGMKRKHHPPAEKRHSVPQNLKYAPVTKNSDCSKGLHNCEPFDICLSGSNSALQASFHARMMQNQNEAEDMVEFANPEHKVEFTDPIVLRPGMVLLKNYVTLGEQVEIVKTCRELGLGPGGFYQPGFQHGAKLRLQMMCLGLNWDPETRKYDDIRPIDGTWPPGIPHEFKLLVKRAIQEAHAHIKDKIRCSSVEKMLPSMTPNICIANFYTTSGRLGLHQDRDESKKSLQEGLPVVSISIGDSADFLYGDTRDIGKAENVVLESGDVLIFGGRSRHIFHGVTPIIPNSAPHNLLEETRLRPGRLNLTFRQY